MNTEEKDVYSRLNDKRNKSQKIQEVNERLTALQTKAVRHIAGIPEGQIFLNILMRQCGFHEPSIVQSLQTGEVNANATIVNEAIRGLYVQIRRMIPPNKLQKIEFMNLRKLAEAMVKEESEGENK